MKKSIYISIVLFVLLLSPLYGREYVSRTYVSSLKQELPYKVLYPSNFDPSHSYPVLLFLHGAGERGVDNMSQLVHGGEKLRIDKTLDQVIVIVPQCPKEDYWVNIQRPVSNVDRTFPENSPISASLLAVKELLDSFISLGFVNVERIYGTGLSMGAFGILDLTVRYPDLFAAVEPICGGINANRIGKYSGRTAFRFFHGLKDNVVSPVFSQEASAILQKNGIDALLVEFPDANHNSWDSAFATPDFISWLLKH